MPVLLVEDDTMIRLTLSDFFEQTGLDILEAGDAEDALAMLDVPAVHIDILITDVDLGPGDNGLVLAAKLRMRFPNLQVVYATGSPEKFAGHTFSPWERVFLKPFSPTALVATVTALNKTSCPPQRSRPRPARVEASLSV